MRRRYARAGRSTEAQPAPPRRNSASEKPTRPTESVCHGPSCYRPHFLAPPRRNYVVISAIFTFCSFAFAANSDPSDGFCPSRPKPAAMSLVQFGHDLFFSSRNFLDLPTRSARVRRSYGKRLPFLNPFALDATRPVARGAHVAVRARRRGMGVVARSRCHRTAGGGDRRRQPDGTARRHRALHPAFRDRCSRISPGLRARRRSLAMRARGAIDAGKAGRPRSAPLRLEREGSIRPHPRRVPHSTFPRRHRPRRRNGPPRLGGRN